MQRISAKLTVYFEDPFWVGILERQSENGYEVCKITFGAEPNDGEVWEMMLKDFSKLRFSPNIHCKTEQKKRINPKRVQREIHKQIQTRGIGTKAQQALKLMQEQNKKSRKVYSKEQREEEKQRKYDLRQKKRKEKHKGH